DFSQLKFIDRLAPSLPSLSRSSSSSRSLSIPSARDCALGFTSRPSVPFSTLSTCDPRLVATTAHEQANASASRKQKPSDNAGHTTTSHIRRNLGLSW